jgi:hypothetical protein
MAEHSTSDENDKAHFVLDESIGCKLFELEDISLRLKATVLLLTLRFSPEISFRGW